MWWWKSHAHTNSLAPLVYITSSVVLTPPFFLHFLQTLLVLLVCTGVVTTKPLSVASRTESDIRIISLSSRYLDQESGNVEMADELQLSQDLVFR